MELGNISTLAQLSFGVNAVIGYMLKRYHDEISSLAVAATPFLGEQKVEEVSVDILDEDLIQSFEEMSPEFKRINSYYDWAICYSLLCLLISFAVLLSAAINPTFIVNSFLFGSVSIMFILINPVIYYLLESRLNDLVSQFKSALSELVTMNDEEVTPFKQMLLYSAYKRIYKPR